MWIVGAEASGAHNRASAHDHAWADLTPPKPKLWASLTPASIGNRLARAGGESLSWRHATRLRVGKWTVE